MRPPHRSLVRWLPPIATASGMIALGAPDGLTSRAWWTAAVFAATIVGFVARPLPMGPTVLVGLTALLLTGALGEGIAATQALLAGFADETVWLVVAAFLLSGSVVRTELAKRVALGLIRRCGGTTLGLGYSLAGAELILGPVIPATTARGGGVMAPIVNALATALGASPYGERRRTGAYLVLCGAHVNLVASAMFLTGMAANPTIGLLAREHLDVAWDWLTWLKGSWLPGLASMTVLPWFLYLLCPPDLADGRVAQQDAAAVLDQLGPWNWRQQSLALLLAGLVAAWATQPWHGVNSTGVALVGLAAILVLGIDQWTDMVGDRGAWDALIWLGGLVTMAGRLQTEGVVAWFADGVAQQVAGFSGVVTTLLLALIYFFSMYGFSMLTGHIMALAGVFFVVAHAAGCPPLLIVALIAYFSNLCGCLTNYSTGPVVIYYGLGYVSTARWLATGLAVAALHLAIWLGLGMPYWRTLGWW